MPDGQLHDVVHYLRRVVAPGGMGGVCDAELLERFVQDRDEAAFELLVWRHGKMVFGVCRRLLRHEQDAEDAFQATFVALARRAGALSRRESVGGWLYRVAYRIALRARADTARRTARQRAAPLRGEHVNDAAEEAASRELRQVIDDEVNRLPAKYRVPFVLCQLGGYSNAEAARELGCPVGTVESWLARARRRLRGGLMRRGVVVPAALFTAGMCELVGPAEVSAALSGPTARSALLVMTGRSAGGVISTRVLTWAEGALPSMYASKIKIAAAILITVGLAGTGAGVGGWGYRPAAAGPSGPTEGVASSQGKNDRIAKLVQQLGSERFAEREQAVKELDKVGPPALTALREAARSNDPEVHRRAAELARKIEERQDREEILRPKRVHLIYKDTPLHEALSDFQKKCGYLLTLHDPNGKLEELKKRRITLDTGDVTFWEALELFCKEAGLVEAGGHASGQPTLPIALDAGMPGLPAAPRPAARGVPPALPAKRMGPPPGGLPAPAVPAPAAPRVQPPPPGAAPPQPAPAAQPGQPPAPPAAVPPQAPAAPAPQPGQPPLPPGGVAPRPPAGAPQPGQPPALPAAAPPQAPGAPAPQPGPPGAIPAAPAAPPGALMRPPLLPARLLPGDSGIHWQGSESTSITLREGELRKAPTVQAGAIRLRLLDKVFGQPVEKGEFMLQIAAEPNLGWRKATALRIDKAVDDREQQWQFLSLDAGSSFKIAMDVATRTPEIAPAFGGLIPLLLKNGDESAKSLKELKGVITAEVLSRPKTLLTIEDVRKVNDETFELPGGGVCKIRAKRATANELLVDVEFIEMPPSAGPQKVFTCVLSTGDEGSEEERKMDVNISPPEIVRQRIHIALAKNSKPLRLVLRRQHVLTLRIPFTFKDVPLP